MAQPDACDEGRKAFAARQWRAAYNQFATADAGSPIGASDLERFAAAAYLIGEEAEALEFWARLHQHHVDAGADDVAAKWAFWIGLLHLLGGRAAQANGWCARARRVLRGDVPEGPASGYGAVIDGLMGGPDVQSIERFDEAVALATRYGDPDLLVASLLGRGQVLIQTGEVAKGIDLLDEAMVTVLSGKVTPVLAGLVYCAMVLSCQSVFDLERAIQWTRELDAWCATQPDLVPYRGQCLVHRSEVFQFHGDWPAAQAEADKALAHLGRASETVVGRACYQRGELHRLRGEFEAAAEMYREAEVRGCAPQPGSALMQLAEGHAREARIALQTELGSSSTVKSGNAESQRLRLLGSFVEVLVASGDLQTARTAAEELTAGATEMNAPLLDAMALHATGILLLGERKANAGRSILAEALSAWQQLENPYQAARARLHMGEAHLALGDTATARKEFELARVAFERLGAGPDLKRTNDNLSSGPRTSGLTAREIEVLSRVAKGETNRQIALTLDISEHTVARHLSNIFDKTGTGNRTEASTHAQRAGLV